MEAGPSRADHAGMDAEVRQVTGCGECASPLLEVPLQMADGQVTFRMCLRCESRSWQRGGVRITRHQAVQHPPKR